MPALDARTVLIRNPDMVCGEVDGELIALSLDTGSYLHMNAPASRILALFEEQARPLSPQDLCALLLSEYDVSESDCLRDVLAMAQRCVELDLLRLAPA